MPQLRELSRFRLRSLLVFMAIACAFAWWCLIADISLHPSRPLLATCGNDGTVSLVDTRRGCLLRKLRLGPTRGDILQVDFSPDGKLLAIAMSNGAVVILRTPAD